MGFIQSIPNRRMLRRAAATLAGSAGATMLLGAGVASAAPGYPVPSFGAGGTTIETFGANASKASGGGGTVVAANGDIYQVGFAQDASSYGQLYVARYLPDGALDQTFGTGGVAYPTVNGVTSSASNNGPVSVGTYVALTPSGEPVVLTQTETSSYTYKLAVLELTQSGALDTSFNAGGAQPGIDTIQVGGNNTYTGGLAVQSNGQIVLTGSFDSGRNTEFFAERLNADGSVDNGFGPSGNGILAEQLGQDGTYSAGTAVIGQSNGDLVFAASADDAAGDSEFAVTRLTASGQPDDSFNGSGTAYVQIAGGTSPYSMPTSLTATSDGGYAVVGEASDTSFVTLAVARFTPAGQLDPTFGNGGIFELSQTSGSYTTAAIATGVFAQPDGKLIISGASGVFPVEIAPMVMRLNANGSIDTGFGSAGATPAPVGYQLAVPAAAAETTDGNLVLSGVDEAFISSGTASFLEQVNLDAAPSVVLATSASTVQAGTPVQFVAAAVGADDESISQVSWDLGTGSFGAATGSSATATFTSPGTYTVRVKATDGFGMSSTATQTVTVTAAPIVTPAISRAARLKLVKVRVVHGKVKVTLLCAFANCSVDTRLSTHAHLISGRTSSLSAGGHGKLVTVGSDKLRIAQDHTRTFTIKLNRLGRRLLKAFHKIPATASFKLTNVRPAQTIHHKVRIG